LQYAGKGHYFRMRCVRSQDEYPSQKVRKSQEVKSDGNECAYVSDLWDDDHSRKNRFKVIDLRDSSDDDSNYCPECEYDDNVEKEHGGSG